MASDRGPYRAIAGVLLDGPDFQLLPERARFAFLVTKINFGPAGLDVAYPQALAATVAGQTGMPYEDALEHVGPGGTLHRAGWLEWEQNVVWIMGQLQFEPNMKPSDPKHRKSIQRHVMGLPRIGVVARFIQAHPDWFAFDGEGLDDAESENLDTLRWALLRAYEGPSMAPATTEDREPKTENREPKTERGAHGRAPRRRGWRVFPADYVPTDADRSLATELAVDIEQQLLLIRDHEFKDARHDPGRTLRKWLRNAAKFAERDGAMLLNGRKPPIDPDEAMREQLERELI